MQGAYACICISTDYRWKRVRRHYNGVDKEYVYFAVPNDNQMETRAEDGSDRQFWFGNPGYFGGPMWGYPGYFAPQRRFRRVILPLAALTAISLLPWY
ncbi:hypothetical protein [Paracerasibacillus soli]|uniref:Uncharacterized protein n=1 Tax=Paracerasibacillus soli TaxID=480284 RepID=A0ABU5CPS0_9BACI|nr:hypothetical protein [Virgibacillus soli]MDY0407876.1 hypothetical protein [Virgibacillus soli]